MFQQLKEQLYKDFVSGAFNRFLWGYLKQIKPDKANNMTLLWVEKANIVYLWNKINDAIFIQSKCTN